jgi:hypothetical protein
MPARFYYFIGLALWAALMIAIALKIHSPRPTIPAVCLVLLLAMAALEWLHHRRKK